MQPGSQLRTDPRDLPHPFAHGSSVDFSRSVDHDDTPTSLLLFLQPLPQDLNIKAQLFLIGRIMRQNVHYI